MSDSRMVTPLPCSLGLTLSQTTMVLLWQLCGSTRFSLEVSRLHQQSSVSLWCAGQRGDTETLFLWLYMSSRAFLCCLMPAGFLLWNYFLLFQTYFFLSCGGDIKNLVFWWKTHLIKNIFNSCVVYCNSLADFSDFLFHWPLEEKKINVLYRTLKQPWILLHKLHPSPAPLLTNPVLFKVWYTPAPHPTPAPNRDLSSYKQKTSRQHIHIILYVKALVFSVATLWTKLKPL